MKFLRKAMAAALAVLMLLSLAGCHKANEVAVDYGEVSFTSAVYSFALLNADSEAKSKVEETLEEGETADTVDYFSKQIDGVSFEEWVKNRALELLDTQAAYRVLCKQNGVTLDEDTLKSVDSYVNQYYSYYEALLSLNGIGKQSYREMMLGNAYSDAYFNYLYGEGGSKEVAKEELKTSYDTNYRTVVLLKKDLSSLTSDTDIAAAKQAVDSAKERLDAGESLLDVYNLFNGATADTKVTELKNAMSLVSDSEVDSNYGVPYFADVKDLADGKSYLYTTDSTQYTLVVRVDTSADNTYFENVEESLRWNLKSEEFDADVEAFADTLTRNVHKYAIKPFTVKGIKQPTQQ